MTDCLLEIRDGTFAYEENRYAIRHIHIKIHKGEKIAVIGNNGGGKSTFFLALNGILHLEEGKVFLHGQEVDYKRNSLIQLRKSVGMVFQDPDHQIIGSTVEGEISFGLFNMGMKENQVRVEADGILKSMNLTEYAGRPPHYLSGGEKKRVSIADILVMNPEIILFDEPTASLDWENTKLFQEQADKLHEEGRTLLVSTHDMDFVWGWADRVVVFSRGEVIADDVPEAVFAREDILRSAALRKPILFELYEEMLQSHIAVKKLMPRTMAAFRQSLQE